MLTLNYHTMPIGLAFSCFRGDLMKAKTEADLVKIKKSWEWGVVAFKRQIPRMSKKKTMFDGLTQQEIAMKYLELAEEELNELQYYA